VKSGTLAAARVVYALKNIESMQHANMNRKAMRSKAVETHLLAILELCGPAAVVFPVFE
jgi:hypothetical protein